MLILFEHAAGYALFNVKEFEEIGMVLSQVESSITDIAKFRNVVRLLAFAPFKTAANALDNLNNISEGNKQCTYIQHSYPILTVLENYCYILYSL